MLTIDKKIFEECEKQVKEKEKRKEVNFILSTPLFVGMNQDYFGKEFLPWFVELKVKKSDKVITDGNIANYLFLIKEGEYSISFSKSLCEIDYLIEGFGGNAFEDKRLNINVMKVIIMMT